MFVVITLFCSVFPGLPADRGGLAEDPDGALSGHQSTRRHEDVAEVCQPLREERTTGKIHSRGESGDLLSTHYVTQNNPQPPV